MRTSRGTLKAELRSSAHPTAEQLRRFEKFIAEKYKRKIPLHWELDESLPFRDQSDRELWDAVMALPPKYRAVVHLYYWEGYDQGEIGDILHLSRTAVQTRMARARDMLRKELGDSEQLLAHDGAGHAR